MLNQKFDQLQIEVVAVFFHFERFLGDDCFFMLYANSKKNHFDRARIILSFIYGNERKWKKMSAKYLADYQYSIHETKHTSQWINFKPEKFTRHLPKYK